MDIKRKELEANKLRIPIYSMESFGDYVYLGGGGGYEIKNMIVGYKYEAGNPIMSKVVHEELTGTGVANYMTVPKDVSEYF